MSIKTRDEYLDEGLRRAAEALGDSPAAICTVLKYALIAQATDQFGDIPAIRAQVKTGALSRNTLMRQQTEWLPPLINAVVRMYPALESFLGRDEIRRRIATQAVDDLLSERLSPELLLAPEPTTLSALPIFALVFTAFPHVTNELYPLLVDTYVAGETGFQVLAAHESWIADGRLRRAIYLHDETQQLLEADLAAPLPIAAMQVLTLDLREEAAAHQRIEQMLLGIPFVNPYAGASVLDRKAETAAIWANAGLLVPRFAAISGVGEMVEAANAVLELIVQRFTAITPRIIVKPVDSTEGQGVLRVDTAGSHGLAAVTAHVEMLARAGGAIITEERGTLRYADACGPVRFAVRLNVCWDGESAHAESGYAQVAPDPETVASAGRGGRLVPLDTVWARLCLPDGTPFTPNDGAWAAVITLAETGATTLGKALGPAMPRLTGIDVLLDAGRDGDVLPILLEANPRPAGMGHSRFVTKTTLAGEPGVSLYLWSLIKRRFFA